MNEIVIAVKRVTDIMSEIASASNEQSVGIEQVNQTIAMMDVVTQQNSALVEQAAAAAESMDEQAGVLMKAVSMFKLDTMATKTHAAIANQVYMHHHPAVTSMIGKQRRSAKPQARDEGGDWKEF